MNATQIIPFSYGQNQVRTITIDDNPYFVATDVCAVLGIKNVSDIINRVLDADERMLSDIPMDGRVRRVWLINESGLYALIMRSHKPEAKAFRKWVTNTVLPSILKTGNFTVTNYTLESSGQLALFPHNESHVRNEIKKQMMEVALSTRSTTVRKLLRLLKPIVFNQNPDSLQ